MTNTRSLTKIILRLLILNILCIVAVAELEQPSKARANLCENDKKYVLNMDVEWVMHCATFSFTGFFVEFLGISKSLREFLPQSRLVQSMFRYSLEESALQNEVVGYETDTKFLDGLFPIEKEIIFEMYNTEQTKPLITWQGDDNINKNNNTARRPVPVFFKGVDVDLASVCTQDGSNFEVGTAFIGGRLARYRAPSTKSPLECCEACFHQPLCTMWTYDIVAVNERSCTLHGSKPQLELGFQPTAVSGKMTHKPSADDPPNTPVPRRMTAPKAIIFHSTACVYRNESVQLSRNIDTIMIGRYMLERSEFHSGLSLDEYSVSMCLQFMDELWVPTEWHRAVFQNIMKQHGIRAPAIAVIPEAIDTTLFDPALVSDSQSVMSGRGRDCSIEEGSGRVKCEKSTTAFQFLSIFKWEYRKGWDILLKAYLNTFNNEDDVVLRLRTYVPSFDKSTDPNITKTIHNFMRRNALSTDKMPRIIWENGVMNSEGVSTSDALTRAEIRDLLGTVDAFVLPTRGEGWGLPIAEAMAMELPVIVTNYSGPTAFINEDNAYLIPVLPEKDADSYAQPDEEALRILLKQVILDYNRYPSPKQQQPLEQDTAEVSAAQGSTVAALATISSLSSTTVATALSTASEDEEVTTLFSVAVLKGRAARNTMKEFSPDSVVCAINARLRELAKFRGWNFP